MTEENRELTILVANLGLKLTDNVDITFNEFLKTTENIILAQDLHGKFKDRFIAKLAPGLLDTHEATHQCKEAMTFTPRYNVTFWKNNETVSDISHGDPSHAQVFSEELSKRSQIFKLEKFRKKILFVNLHGHGTYLGGSVENRKNTLLACLVQFDEIRNREKCDYMFIGGDFNIDLDELEKAVLSLELNLKVVPYGCPRKLRNRKEKFDGLICSKDLWQKGKVVVYHETTFDFEGEEVDNNTDVIRTEIAYKILDHDPILFTLYVPKKEDLVVANAVKSAFAEVAKNENVAISLRIAVTKIVADAVANAVTKAFNEDNVKAATRLGAQIGTCADNVEDHIKDAMKKTLSEIAHSNYLMDKIKDEMISKAGSIGGGTENNQNATSQASTSSATTVQALEPGMGSMSIW